MTKKIIFISLFAVLAYSSLVLSAKAQTMNTLEGLNETAGKVSAYDTKGAYDTNFLATRTGQIIGIVLSFVGILFLGLMIYAGITWMTANGNEQTVAKAKDMIINASIGIVIVLAAYAITTYVGDFIVNSSQPTTSSTYTPPYTPPATELVPPPL